MAGNPTGRRADDRAATHDDEGTDGREDPDDARTDDDGETTMTHDDDLSRTRRDVLRSNDRIHANPATSALDG